MSISLLYTDRFSKFFHWHAPRITCNKMLKRSHHVLNALLHYLVKYNVRTDERNSWSGWGSDVGQQQKQHEESHEYVHTCNKCTKHQFIHLLTAILKNSHIENSKKSQKGDIARITLTVCQCKIRLAAVNGPSPKTPLWTQKSWVISYTDRVIANFVPNFVAMATGVGRGKCGWQH